MSSQHTSIHDKDFVFDPKYPPAFGCTPFHRPLNLVMDNKTYCVLGGSCIHPSHHHADIYISLDLFASTFEWEQPWQQSFKQHIRFFIEDNQVPEDVDNFNCALNYTLEAIKSGKSIHIGCISGHGRTGLFLSALTQLAMKKVFEKEHLSAIDYVRNNYCAWSVENIKQVLFLYSYYDILPPKKEKEHVIHFLNDFQTQTGFSFTSIVKKDGFHIAWEFDKYQKRIQPYGFKR